MFRQAGMVSPLEEAACFHAIFECGYLNGVIAFVARGIGCLASCDQLNLFEVGSKPRHSRRPGDLSHCDVASRR
jgi:hypothetical protein